MSVRSKNTHWLVRDELANRTPDVVRDVNARLPKDFPSAVCDPIFNGLLASAERLMS